MGNQETSVYASTVIEQAEFLFCKYFFNHLTYSRL